MVAAVNIQSNHNTFDLAIVGSGMVGMCVAWCAAQQYPQWRIAVFEQSAIGSGATLYAASLDMPYGHTHLRYHLAARSKEIYAALRKALPLPIKDLSFYGIVRNENAANVLTQLTDSNAKNSPDEVALLHHQYPDLVIPEGKTIIAGGTASQAISNESPQIIAEHFAGKYHCLYEYTGIDSITYSQQHYCLLTTTGQSFFAKRIVQATGPWINPLLTSSYQISPFLRVKKIIAFHIMQQPKPDAAVLYFFDDDAFLMPKYEAGYWLFSFTCNHWDVLPDRNTLQIEEADRAKAQSILKKYYPSFVHHCKEGRVFCDAYTDTGDPLITHLGGDGNYVFAGACAGSGFRLAPAIAEQAINYFVKPV